MMIMIVFIIGTSSFESAKVWGWFTYWNLNLINAWGFFCFVFFKKIHWMVILFRPKKCWHVVPQLYMNASFISTMTGLGNGFKSVKFESGKCLQKCGLPFPFNFVKDSIGVSGWRVATYSFISSGVPKVVTLVQLKGHQAFCNIVAKYSGVI